MNEQSPIKIERTSYNRDDCQIGIVHVGYGAFHRAHQAVFVDDYMQRSGDLDWGIAAVNLREEESDVFQKQPQAYSKAAHPYSSPSAIGVGLWTRNTFTSSFGHSTIGGEILYVALVLICTITVPSTRL